MLPIERLRRMRLHARATRARIVVGALVLTLFVAGGIALAVWGANSLPLDSDDQALRVGVGIVLTFLVVLVIRYVLLLWLGFLHHIETDGALTTTPTGPLPGVTAIVPVYNEELVVADAVRSLLALQYPALEVLVVDDGSTDETVARAAALEGVHGGTTVRVVRKRNGGKASALNTGIALARTPFVLCMDGDTRLTPDTLHYAMRHFHDARV